MAPLGHILATPSRVETMAQSHLVNSVDKHLSTLLTVTVKRRSHLRGARLNESSDGHPNPTSWWAPSGEHPGDASQLPAAQVDVGVAFGLSPAALAKTVIEVSPRVA
jgi:hypothetical protein